MKHLILYESFSLEEHFNVIKDIIQDIIDEYDVIYQKFGHSIGERGIFCSMWRNQGTNTISLRFTGIVHNRKKFYDMKNELRKTVNRLDPLGYKVEEEKFLDSEIIMFLIDCSNA